MIINEVLRDLELIVELEPPRCNTTTDKEIKIEVETDSEDTVKLMQCMEKIIEHWEIPNDRSLYRDK